MPTYDEVAKRMLSFETGALGTGATDEDIAHAERLLGVCIRGGYRQFLRQFGWGGVEHLELYGLGADVPTCLNLVAITCSERQEMQPSLRQCFLPIMNDGAGNLYCLDTNTIGEPVIVFWDHTAGTDQEPVIVAGDFASWLHEQLETLKI